MKMVSLVDGIFWGIVLIGLGAWFLLRHALPVRIGLFRILVAALLVWFGIRILIHGPVIRDGDTIVFGQSHLEYPPRGEKGYNVIFSNGTIDLTGIRLSGSDIRTEVNVIFGAGTLRIDPSKPVRVDMTSAFGSVESPDGRAVAFGDSVYTSPAYAKGAPAIEIHAVAVFGRLSISP